MEQTVLILNPEEPTVRVCVDIMIVDDFVVERTEELILHLTSDDDGVSILTPRAIVLIKDDDCKFSPFFRYCHICDLIFCQLSTLLTFG